MEYNKYRNDRIRKKSAGGRIMAILMILILTLTMLIGCGNQSETVTDSAVAGMEAGNAFQLVEVDPEDLDDTWDSETAEVIQLGGKDVTIREAGTYVLEGTLEDGQVIVAAGEEDLVRLVLNGAVLSSSDSSVIQVDSADKVVLILAEGTEMVTLPRRMRIFRMGRFTAKRI